MSRLLILATLAAHFAGPAVAQPTLAFDAAAVSVADLVSAADGTTFVVGNFQGTVDFEPSDGSDASDTLTSQTPNQGDSFVVSYDGAGVLRWVFRIGPGLQHLAVAGSQVYVAGGTPDGYDVDPGAGTAIVAGTQLIAAYDQATGAFRWVDGFGRIGLGGLAAAGARVLAVGRYARGTAIDFDPGSGTYGLTSGNPASWAAVYSAADGAFAWGAGFGGPDTVSFDDRSAPSALADADRVYLSGSFSGPADFDPGPGTETRTEGGAYVVALDAASGAFRWATTAPAIESHTSALGGEVVVIAGSTFLRDFDPGTGTAMIGPGAFMAAYDRATGAFRWADGFAETVTWNDLAADANYVYGVGAFRTRPADFDPGAGTQTLPFAGGFQDLVLAAYRATDGIYVWAGGIGNDQRAEGFEDVGRAITVSEDRVGIGGQFVGTVDLDPGGGAAETTAGGSTAFLAFYNAASGAYAPFAVAAEERGGAGRLVLTVAPNPAQGRATVTVSLNAPRLASVAVYDLLGREVTRLHDGPLASGMHPFAVEAASLPAGVYVVRASTEAGLVAARLTLVR